MQIEVYNHLQEHLGKTNDSVIIAKAKKLLVKYPAGILPKASFFYPRAKLQFLPIRQEPLKGGRNQRVCELFRIVADKI